MVPATLSDVRYVARNLEHADRMEAFMLGVDDPVVAACELLMRSQGCWVYGRTHRPISIYGVLPAELSQPCSRLRCWMLSTSDYPRHMVGITRAVRKVLDRLESIGFQRFEIISADFKTDAHRWFERSLGFRRVMLLPEYGECDFVLHERRR